MTNAIQRAADLIGTYKIAEACGVRGPSVYKWLEKGRLPRTEWSGETNYAEKIEIATDGQVKKIELLTLPIKKI